MSKLSTSPLPIDQLTPSAIPKLLKQDTLNQQIIVQVFDIKLASHGRYKCNVSDGNHYIVALLSQSCVLRQGEDQLSVVCITSHGVLKKKSIGIEAMKLITHYPEKLGNPIEWNPNYENQAFQSPKTYYKLDKLQKTIKPQPSFHPSPISPAKSSQYESIDDLHIGLSRWVILCRITRKIMKQTAKKGTKLLEIDLVDKSKKKIIGTFFGDAAQNFNDYLKQGSVYEISKGSLIQGNYNNSRNEKLSPFSLIFDAKSQFNQVSDVNIISRAEDTAITLGEVYQKRIFNQQFDIVGYVVEVKPQTKIPKQQKILMMKQVTLADPDNKIIMDALLWNWKQQFGDEMVGRVLIFSRFSLKQYKDNLSIYNGYRSAIITNHGHPMKKYQNKPLDLSQFAIITKPRQYQQTNQSQLCHNTKELLSRINSMHDSEIIKSVLVVWINRFAHHKKWCYQACKKCKKAALRYKQCQHCKEMVDQTNLSFSMGVQLADYYGSIWTTIYDELGKKIFADLGSTATHTLQSLSTDQLTQKLQNYQYQSLKLRILTKKDEQGRIRHNASRMFDLIEEKQAVDNLKKILSIIYTNT